MSDDDKDPKDTQGKLTLGDIRNLIKEIVGESKNGTTKEEKDVDYTAEAGTTREERKGVGSVAEVVKAELARLKEQEDRQKSEKDLRDEVAAIKAKQNEEPPPPIERRRVHRFMGWGENS